MKINLIIPSFYPATVYGGPIFSTLHACEILSECDSVEVFVSTTNANRDSKLDVELNKWIQFKDKFYVKYYNTTLTHTISIPMFFNIWREIKSSDIIHIQPVFNVSSLFALIYSKWFLKPILISPRGSFCEKCLTQGSPLKRLWLKYVITPLAYYVHWHVTSDSEKKDLLKLYPNSKISVISNGVDFSLLSNINMLKKNEYIKHYTNKEMYPSKIIISMGRLHKIKGFDILIKAFPEILKTYPKAVLLIAGEDVGEKIHLERVISELQLKKSIYFVGELSGQEKINFLANADLFVLPSHSENFGNVYAESLAVGTPIVASTGTPWQEVESAGCGKWVKNSVEETAKAMLEILTKDSDILAKNAKKFAKKFDWKKIGIQFEILFTEMLN